MPQKDFCTPEIRLERFCSGAFRAFRTKNKTTDFYLASSQHSHSSGTQLHVPTGPPHCAKVLTELPGHRTCWAPGRCPCGSLSWVWSHQMRYLKQHYSRAQCLGSGAAPVCPIHLACVATPSPEPRGSHPVLGTESKQVQLLLPRMPGSCRATAPIPGGAELCAAGPSQLLWCQTLLHMGVLAPGPAVSLQHPHVLSLYASIKQRHKQLQRTGYKDED